MYNEMGLLMSILGVGFFRVLFFIIGIIVDIVIAFFFSAAMNDIKEDKGYSNEFHFFALCIWLGFLGWFITAAIVIALPDLRLQEEIRRLSNKLDGAIGGNANGNVGPEKGASVSSLGNAYSLKSNSNNDDPYFNSLFKDDV